MIKLLSFLSNENCFVGHGLNTTDLFPHCYLIHNGLHDKIQYGRLQTASLFFLSNCCISFIFLMMAYDYAETLNKTMNSTFVAIYTVRIKNLEQLRALLTKDYDLDRSFQ